MACPACGSSERTRIAPGFFRCDANLQHLSNAADGGVEVWYSRCGREYQDSDPGMAGGTGVLCNCGCGLYAVGECTRCGQGFSGDHRGAIDGAFVCLGCFDQHREEAAQRERDERGVAQRGQSLEEAARSRRDAEVRKAQEKQRERDERQRVEDEFRAKSRAYKDSLVAWAAELAVRLTDTGAPPDRRLMNRTVREETVHLLFRTKTRTVAGPTEYCNGWILSEHQWLKESAYHEDRGTSILDQGRAGVLLAQSGTLINYNVSTQNVNGPCWLGQPSKELLPGQWARTTFREDEQPRSAREIGQGDFSCIWRIESRLHTRSVLMRELEPALSDLAIRMNLL